MHTRLKHSIPALALRLLTKDRARVALNIAGVSFPVVLMLMLNGFYQGALARDVKYLSTIDAPIFAFAKGTAAYYQVSTPISTQVEKSIASHPQIQDVIPIYTIRASVEQGTQLYTLFISGFDPKDTRYGPWTDSSARQLPADGILLPRQFARRMGLHIGDTVILTGPERTLTLSGLVPEASSFGRHHAWVTTTVAQQLYPLPHYSSFLLVFPRSEYSPNDLIADLNKQFPQVSFRTKLDQLRVARDFQADSFSPILFAMTTIALFVGSLIIGIVLYSSVYERRKEYGVLSALGYSTSALARIIAWQALLITITSYILGTLASQLLATVLQNSWELPVSILPGSLALAASLSFIMAILGSLPAIKLISHVAPAEVFR